MLLHKSLILPRVASSGGETSNPTADPKLQTFGEATADKLFKTLEEWNDYLERHAPTCRDLEPGL